MEDCSNNINKTKKELQPLTKLYKRLFTFEACIKVLFNYSKEGHKYSCQ